MKLEKEFSIMSIESFIDTPDITVTGNIKLNKNEKLTTYWNGKYKATLILEMQDPILDEEEKKYLSGVIRPFRDRIEFIRKSCIFEQEYINVVYNSKFKDDTNFCLPLFEKGTMYKNMTLNKEYTLEELGL